MTMPITFEWDCSTETYTEAKEREHSGKHEQATCVRITLIDGAVVNLIKTQKNTDGEYLEEMKTFKWIDFSKTEAVSEFSRILGSSERVQYSNNQFIIAFLKRLAGSSFK